MNRQQFGGKLPLYSPCLILVSSLPLPRDRVKRVEKAVHHTDFLVSQEKVLGDQSGR